MVKGLINRVIIVFLAFFMPVIISSCSQTRQQINTLQNETSPRKVLEQIKMRGRLIAVTEYNSANYFLYKGAPMGFQYDLLRSLAESLGVELDIVIRNNVADAIELLKAGQVDIAALDMTITSERSNMVLFTQPIGRTRQVIVQRKSDSNPQYSIESSLDLNGKSIVVEKNSVFASKLRSLANENGIQIKVIEHPSLSAEELIAQVNNGSIDYTVVDDRLAMINRSFFPKLDISIPISMEQNYAWALPPQANGLKQLIDDWLSGYDGQRELALLSDKYFSRVKYRRVIPEVNNYKASMISGYDGLFKKLSRGLGWDWRLLASLVYQESKFNDQVKSHSGAFGIMQLMPATAKSLGVDSSSSPHEQIRAGVSLLLKYDRFLAPYISNDKQRVPFVVAAYNTGVGHILDARRLAEKYGKDPDNWEDVAYFVKNKSNPKYYNDSVAYYGYSRGEETYQFVRDIMDRYHHYKNLVDH